MCWVWVMRLGAQLGHAEVQDDRLAVLADHDVLGLEIPVDDAVEDSVAEGELGGVGVLQALKDGVEDGQADRQGKARRRSRCWRR